MSDTLTPPAATRAASTAADKLAECRALYGQMLNRTQLNALDGLKFGKLLIEAKAEVKGRGDSWLRFLKERWPTLSPRTAQAWMRRAFDGGAALSKELMDGTFPDQGDETDEELEEYDPSDPHPDRGDANEDDAEPEAPTRKPKAKPAAKKPAQTTIDMDPELTRAKALVAEARDSGEAFIDYVEQVLASRAGNELRKHARLASWEFTPNRWPPANLIRSWLEKISRQGFE